jgi:peptide/nickel transport system substrate-binding protein
VDRTNQVTGRSGVVILVSILAVLTMLAAACGKSSSSSSSSGTQPPAAKNGTNITVANPGQPKAGGTLNFGLNAETNGWSPAKDQWAGSAYIVAGSIFDHLAEYDDKDIPKPYLAESITSNADFTEWTIKVRPDVTFQDGEKCDAAAIKQNFDVQRDPASITAPVFQTVTAVDVVDPLTVKLTMKQPWSTFPHTLTTQPGAMAAPKAMLDKPDGGANNPVGTGPFSFVKWVQNDTLTVKKNPTYWRKGYPLLDGITFKILTDPASRSSALLTGEEDAIEQGDPIQIGKLSSAAQKQQIQFFTDSGLQQSEAFSAFNTAQAPFNDILAREIVAYATDTTNLSKVAFGGVFKPAQGPFGPNEPYYTPDAGWKTYNLAKAKELEKQYEQKYGHPLQFSLLITPAATVQSIAAFVQQNLKQVGADMQIKPEDQATLIADVILGNYTATGFILFGSVTLDTQYVFIAASTVQPIGKLSLNFSRLADQTLTAALDKARTTDDLSEQIAQYKIVQQQMAKDVMFVFWTHDLQSIAYTNKTHALNDYKLPDGSTAQTQIVPLTFAAWKS